MTEKKRTKLSRQDREQLRDPQLLASYEYATQVMLSRLQMINADLTRQQGRVVVRNTSSRLKSVESIEKKLIRKGRETTCEKAVKTLNDIAGIRVVCFFCDDIYRVADALRGQKDIRIIKEKDYIKNPKKSGYQSLHLIAEVPVTYFTKKNYVRVEIQIRSFAMDYWAELDTQMCYKKNAGQIENVEHEIRNYSDLIAKVDNQMLELRKRIEKM